MKMNTFRNLFTALLPFVLAGCMSSNDGMGLQSVMTAEPVPAKSVPQPKAIASYSPQTVPVNPDPVLTNSIPAPSENPPVARAQQAELPATTSSFAAPNPNIIEVPPRESKTFLINGLASSVKAIGYGFTNLSKKIPGSKLYNYASFIESSTVIRRSVTRQIKAAYRRNPDVEINLIGISFGANIVTIIASELNRSGIPVNYLVTMDGPAMVPVQANVAKLDNFTCTGMTCFKTTSRLAHTNKTTQFAGFKINSTHIPLANDRQVHARILKQLAPAKPPMVYSASAQQ